MPYEWGSPLRSAIPAVALILTFPVLLVAVEVVPLGGDAEILSVQVLESDGSRIVLEYDLGSFTKTPVSIGGDTYYAVGLGEESRTREKGMPELPNVSRSIIIPDDAEMDVRVVSSHHVDFADVPVVPSKGVLTRDIDPASVPYSFDLFYEGDTWFPDELALGREPYIMRDHRGMVVVVNPFSYNAGTGTLRVYDRIVVEVVRVGPGKKNVLTARPPGGTPFEFRKIYENHFLNYDGGRYAPVGEIGNMLVICYDDFLPAADAYVQWKKQMGVPCEMVSVTEAGGSAEAIDGYVEDYYYEYGLAFLVLLGDAAQVPPLYAVDGASDPSYSLKAGSDNYPDLLVGRLSAETVSQLETQIERTVEYEKQPTAGAGWYHKGMGVASDQGPGDDGEYDDEHMGYIRDDLLAFTYTEVDEIYDPYGTASMVTDGLNDGRSIVNYCGHGWIRGWSSTGFSNSHVNALVNDDKLPFLVSVACNNGEFDNQTCFGEAWLRATNGSRPAGGVGAYMSSIGQYWDEPMDAQDEIADLVVVESKRTYGGLCYNGSCHMMDEYGESGEDMFLTWIVFGDPSLRVRTDTPAPMAVLHEDSIESTATTFDVTVVGVEEALCSLYLDGTLYGSALTDGSGSATIDIVEPLPGEADLIVTVTAFNRMPYFGSVHVGPIYIPIIEVLPAFFGVTLAPGEIALDTLKISNTGEPGSILNYAIEIVDPERGRNLTGSTVSVEPDIYVPGTTGDFVFSVYNGSSDSEWITDIALDFPSGATVNTCSDFIVSDRELAWDGSTGNGAHVAWSGTWYDVIYPGETAVATVNLTIESGFAEVLEIEFLLAGDGFGGAPHTIRGTVIINPPPGPSLTLTAPNGGEVWGIDEEHDITWTSEGAIPAVYLSYSTDGGAIWNSIASGTPNDGVYEWVVEGPKSTNCYVMISAFGMQPVSDMSDAPFAIFQPIYWLTADPSSGSIPDGSSEDVILEFDSSGMTAGDYFADLIIHSNAGDAVVVPVGMHIEGTGVDEQPPDKVVLFGNFPNPFNPSTTVAFSLPTPGRVRVSVYGVDGRLVAQLADSTFGAGRNAVVWDGRNDAGEEVGSGVYMYRLEALGKLLERKMLMLK